MGGADIYIGGGPDIYIGGADLYIGGALPPSSYSYAVQYCTSSNSFIQDSCLGREADGRGEMSSMLDIWILVEFGVLI